MSMFALPPSKIRKEITTVFEAGLVPFVTSSPGLGKSSIIHQIAVDFGLEVIDLRLSQCAPEDLMGLPMRDGNRAKFASFEMFPLEGDALPKGKNGWILFLDEFNSATKSVQAAAYKIVLDRMVGQAKLHENVFIACAGNLATDRAIVTQQSTAMQSRLIHLEMVPDFNDFMRHANQNGFDHRILGFLEFQPSKLHDFKPDHHDKTFACPRTWEFASRLVKGKPFDEISLPLLAGTISEGVAVELHTFMREYERLPKFSEICRDPESVPVPLELSTQYAAITMLMDKTGKDEFPQVAKFVQKFSPEFQIVFFRGIIQRNPRMKEDPAFNSAMRDLVRFLNDDQADLLRAA